MKTVIAEFDISKEADIRTSAQRARLLATLVDLPDDCRAAFGRAVHEVTANVIVHAGTGRLSFGIQRDGDGGFVEAAVWDDCDGHDVIKETLRQTSGDISGLQRAVRNSDYIKVEAHGKGKVVRVGTAVSSDIATSSDTDIVEWAGILRTRRIQSALASTRRRTRKLAEQLAGVQRQRLELESELQDSRSINETLTLLSLVASKTDNAVIIMDEDGAMTWVNDAFIRMTGFTLHHSTGCRPDELLIGPETAAESIQDLAKAFRLGHGLTEEFLQYQRSGDRSWISLSLTPVHDDDGSVSRWIGIGTDITRRREAQHALEAARDAAEKASRLKGDFLANISHEIRTPMNAIIGMTNLALSTELDDDQQDYLTTVKLSAESLLELLNDVLDLSRIESGRMELEEHAIQVRQLLANSLKPMTVIANQKNLRLNWHVADDVPEWVEGDALRLRQILINLSGNAIKFTESGSIEVTSSQERQLDGSLVLVFQVADTGIGIAPEKRKRIFDVFTQADPSVTRKFGGTGLGLAITSQLAGLMKGQITVESEPGRGSSFRFTVPLRLPSADRISAVSVAVPDLKDPKLERSARPLSVLVADDHHANRQLIAKILEKRGHEAVFADNGRKAVSCFKSHDFDIVLMDVQMPVMDGYQATAQIRDLERKTQRHVPIIAVTAHAIQGERDTCLAAGMDAWLPKPVSSNDLVTLIETLSNNQVNLSAAAVTATGITTVDESNNIGGRPNDDELTRDEPEGHSEFGNALKRLDGDMELLREQMQFFLDDGPKLVTMLRQSVETLDVSRRRIAAHRLKNLCATFDDEQTAALCHHLESLNARSSPGAVNAHVADVSSGVDMLLASIRRFYGA